MIPPRNWRQRAAAHPLTRVIRHPLVTMAALAALFALIFFGTLYQTEHGLYEAQRKYFGYGWVLIGGFFPLPSASVVIWVLSIQLMVTMALVLPWKLSKLGLWVSHLGILALLIGGFITQVMAVETQLTLAEGEVGHYTTAYGDWELAFWESQGDTNRVKAYDAAYLAPGRTLEAGSVSGSFDARIKVHLYYPNCDAFAAEDSGAAQGPRYLNSSGVGLLEARDLEKEAARNVPGILFTLEEPGKPGRNLLLYGADPDPTPLILGGKPVYFQLRLKHYPLDFSLKLTDFVKNVHPGTDVASSFESYADLRENGSTRQVKVWMNNPLRHRGYTFFQASYVQPEGAPEKSIFAVVTNPGRVLPYVSSLVVFGGLLLHFLLRLVPFIKSEAK